MADPPAAASLGQMAVVLKVVTRDEHREMCRIVQSSIRKGRPVSFARLLVRRGVSTQTVERLLARGAELEAVRCDACGASVPQSSLTKRREYPCLRCGGLLLGFRAYSAGSKSGSRQDARAGSGSRQDARAGSGSRQDARAGSGSRQGARSGGEFHRAPAPRPPLVGTGLELDVPTITHGQVLPIPGEEGRRRDLELPTPTGAHKKPLPGSEDSTLPVPDQELADAGGTLLFRNVLHAPGPEELSGGLTTIHFGDVFVLPKAEKAPSPLSEEDLVSAFETLASDQGNVVIEDSAAPEEYAEIGGFKVMAALGEGGMGRVYLARQTRSGRDVALKVLRSTLATDREFLERFHREAQAVTDHSHENVVDMIAAGHDQHYDMHYIAFEYVPGGTLEDLIEERAPLPERQALKITRGIARGLEFTAALGIVHRDVKPSNVIMTEDFKPKLADLGLARHLDATTRVTQAGVVLGTPAYIAPEQATDVEDLDVRADLYALGVCLYEMLTGKLPLEDDVNTAELLLRHVEEDVPDVRLEAPSVSPATAQLVKGLTARLREERYPNPSAALLDVERVLAGKEPLGPRQAGTEAEQPPMESFHSGVNLPAQSAPRPAPKRAPAPAAPAAPRAPLAPAAPAAGPHEPVTQRPPKKRSLLLVVALLISLLIPVVAGGVALGWKQGWLAKPDWPWLSQLGF